MLVSEGEETPVRLEALLHPRLARAVKAAARREMTSQSEIVRRGALKIVREIGIDPRELEGVA